VDYTYFVLLGKLFFLFFLLVKEVLKIKEFYPHDKKKFYGAILQIVILLLKLLLLIFGFP
jgi:hypothetical protein